MPLTIDGVRFREVADQAEAPSQRLAETHAPEAPGAFEKLLHRLGGEIDHGEALVGGSAQARYASMDAGTLIALQAGIYRYSEAVDLTVKLVDRAASAAKTVLEGGR